MEDYNELTKDCFNEIKKRFGRNVSDCTDQYFDAAVTLVDCGELLTMAYADNFYLMIFIANIAEISDSDRYSDSSNKSLPHEAPFVLAPHFGNIHINLNFFLKEENERFLKILKIILNKL